MVYQRTIAAAMLAAGAMAEPHLGLGLDLNIGGSQSAAPSASSGGACEGPKNPGGCREQCFLKALAEVCVLDTPSCRCANSVVLKAAVDACVDLVPLNVCLDIDLTLFGSSFDASCASLDQNNCANAKGRLGPNASGTPVQTPSVAVGTPLYQTPAASATPMTTSVVYETQLHTVTKCASTVTDCPANEKTPEVVTSVVPKYTTVCPVSEAQKTAEPSVAVGTPLYQTPEPSAASSDVQGLTSSTPMTTSVVYETQLHTVTKCASTVTDCPAHEKTPEVVTSVVPKYTTVCPVSEAEKTPAPSTAVGTPLEQSSAPVASSTPSVAVGTPLEQTSSVAGLTSAPAPSAPAPQGPSTVYQTQVSTIYDCPPEVTNCPSHEKTPKAVTSVVPVTSPAGGAPSAPAPSAPAPEVPAASSDVVGLTSAPAPSAPAASAPAPSGPASAPVASGPAPSAPAPSAPAASGPAPSGPAPSAPAPQGPSTVYQTQVSTILDCPPEVTNCPSHEKTPSAVTSVVQSTGPAVPGVPESSVVGLTSGPAPSAPAPSAPACSGAECSAPSGPASAPVASAPAPSAPAASAPACSGAECSAPSGPASAPVASGPAPSAPAPSAPAASAPAPSAPAVSAAGCSGAECSAPAPSAPAPQGPSTVFTTQVSTILDCPPEVTSCPARSKTVSTVFGHTTLTNTNTDTASVGTPMVQQPQPTGSAPAGSAPACSGADCGAEATASVGTPMVQQPQPTGSAPACSGAGCGATTAPACSGADCGAEATASVGTPMVQQPQPTGSAPACSGAGCGATTAPACSGADCAATASVGTPMVQQPQPTGSAPGPVSSVVGLTSSPAPSAPAASSTGCTGAGCAVSSAPAPSSAGCNGSDCPAPAVSTAGCNGSDCPAPSSSAISCTGASCPVPCNGADCVVSSATSATTEAHSFTFAYSSGTVTPTPTPASATPSPPVWTGAAGRVEVAGGFVAVAAAAVLFV